MGFPWFLLETNLTVMVGCQATTAKDQFWALPAAADFHEGLEWWHTLHGNPIKYPSTKPHRKPLGHGFFGGASAASQKAEKRAVPVITLG